MEMKKIIVEVKSVYGNDLIYPVCDDAKTFTVIAGTKTLSPLMITSIKHLGYFIEVKAPNLGVNDSALTLTHYKKYA